MSKKFISSVNTRKIYIATTSNINELKEQKTLYCSLYNSNKIEDMETGYNTYYLILKMIFLLLM